MLQPTEILSWFRFRRSRSSNTFTVSAASRFCLLFHDMLVHNTNGNVSCFSSEVSQILVVYFGYRQIKYPRLQLCRVSSIHSFSMTQVLGKGPRGPAILRAPLVINAPAVCGTFYTSFRILWISTIALLGKGMAPRTICKVSGLASRRII